MIEKLFFTWCSFLPLTCMFTGVPPELLLSTGAHPSHPVLLQSLTINGVELNRMERIADGAWSDPKGESDASLSMPIDRKNRTNLLVTARWIDLVDNMSYSGEIHAHMSDLTVQNLSRRTGTIIVLFGPDGYLELSTSDVPDATGQYNGRIIATTCATAGEGLSTDHWVLRDNYLSERIKNWSNIGSVPVPVTVCTKM